MSYNLTGLDNITNLGEIIVLHAQINTVPYLLLVIFIGLAVYSLLQSQGTMTALISSLWTISFITSFFWFMNIFAWYIPASFVSVSVLAVTAYYFMGR